MSEEKKLIIIRGLSGSGKRTLADIIVSGNDFRTSISSNEFFIDEDGHYSFNAEKIRESHEWCKEQVREEMERGTEIIVVHNTFTKKWEVDPYRDMSDEFDYQFDVISLYDGGLSDKDLSRRCIYNVPSRVIQNQRKKWEKDVYRGDSERPYSRNKFKRGYN